MKNINLPISIEEAQKIILESVKSLTDEGISIMESANRVLYEDIVASTMIPPRDNSAMDGYAVIAADTKGATETSPVKLQVIAEIRAGGLLDGKEVLKGTAIRIMTGAPLPKSADSVIPFEDAGEEAGYIRIFNETVKYSNCRFAGEDIKKGDRVLEKGDRLRSADVGILASLNYQTIKVYKQPTVSIISTGDELAEIGEEVQMGQIRNSNAYSLYSEVKKYSGLPDYLGIVKDTLKDTREMFLKAMKSDVIISTGGVSMGKYDFVKEIYSDLNIETKFEWIKVKPGRPCTFGVKENKLFFGLPGNPVSTLTSFLQFVRPALLRLMGAKRIRKPVLNAILEEDLKKQPGKAFLLRGHFSIRNNEFYVSTTGNQNSSVLRSMSRANCLIVIPENTSEVKAGEKVAIQLIDHDEI